MALTVVALFAWGSGRSLRRGVIAFFRAYGEALAIGVDLDFSVAAIREGVGRRISDEILAAQFCANVDERLGEIVYAVGEEGAAAALVGELLKDLISRIEMIFPRLVGIVDGDPVGIRADRVNGDFGANRLFKSIAEGVIAQVIVPVADEDEYAAYLQVGSRGQRRIYEFFGGHINGVVERRSAAGALAPDRVAQLADIIGKVLNHFRLIVERHEKSHVLVMADDTGEEIDGGILLKLEPGANAVGGIHQEPNAKREIGLAAKEEDLLRRTVFENLEIVLIQVRDEVATAVHHGGHEMNQAGGGYDLGRLLLLAG